MAGTSNLAQSCKCSVLFRLIKTNIIDPLKYSIDTSLRLEIIICTFCPFLSQFRNCSLHNDSTCCVVRQRLLWGVTMLCVVWIAAFVGSTTAALVVAHTSAHGFSTLQAFLVSVISRAKSAVKTAENYSK